MNPFYCSGVVRNNAPTFFARGVTSTALYSMDGQAIFHECKKGRSRKKTTSSEVTNTERFRIG
jgi:hypothetical protein